LCPNEVFFFRDGRQFSFGSSIGGGGEGGWKMAAGWLWQPLAAPGWAWAPLEGGVGSAFRKALVKRQSTPQQKSAAMDQRWNLGWEVGLGRGSGWVTPPQIKIHPGL